MSEPRESPNPAIDRAIEMLMGRIKTKRVDGVNQLLMPESEAVKILNTAIAWEKVKANLKDAEGFDPDSI